MVFYLSIIIVLNKYCLSLKYSQSYLDYLQNLEKLTLPIKTAKNEQLNGGEIPVFLTCPDVDPTHSPKIGYSFCNQ